MDQQEDFILLGDSDEALRLALHRSLADSCFELFGFACGFTVFRVRV